MIVASAVSKLLAPPLESDDEFLVVSADYGALNKFLPSKVLEPSPSWECSDIVRWIKSFISWSVMKVLSPLVVRLR